MFGENQWGQCGIPNEKQAEGRKAWTSTDHVFELLQSGGAALEGRKVVKVALGLRHTLALTDNGQVFAWGKSNRGQLGIAGVTEVSEEGHYHAVR